MPEPHDGPPEPETPDEYRLMPDEPLPHMEPCIPPVVRPDEPPVDAETNQFTLGEPLGLVAVAAVLLSTVSSIARWTSMGDSPASLAAVYATVLGFGALVSMIALAWMPQARQIAKVGWWALLGLYVVAAVAAVLMRK